MEQYDEEEEEEIGGELSYNSNSDWMKTNEIEDHSIKYTTAVTTDGDTTEHTDEWAEYLANTPAGWDEYWQKYSNQLVWHDWCQKFPEMLVLYQEKTQQAFEGLCLGPLKDNTCLLYTSPSPRDGLLSRMPSSA